jgi:hypothetical protein
MDSLEKKIRIISVKSGLILGVILVALGILSFYYITNVSSSAIMFVLVPMLFSLIVPILVVVFICLNVRKKIGGYWNLRQATTGIFIMFFIGYVIQTAGRDFIFAKLIEPDMVQKTQDAFLRASATIKSQGGVDPKVIDKNVADIKKGFEDQKNESVGKIIQGVAISIILTFVLAVIFGALFKREPPLYATVIDEGEQ